MKGSVPTALLLACALVLGAGCQDEDSVTNIYQSENFGWGSFPGSPVSAANLAVDGRALSQPGEAFDAMRFFPSGHGTAVLLFTAAEGGREHLYASYLEAGALTPPVELVGENQDPAASAHLDQAFAVFLRPGNARDGDAIVGFLRQDLQDDGDADPDVGPNQRLYAAYFDRSAASEAVSPLDPDRRWGFDTTPAAVDLSDNDYFGSDVAAAGFLTDGLRGAASFPAASLAEASDFEQGDTTTYLCFLWIQANSAVTPQRLFRRRFDLSEANAASTFETQAQEVGLDAGAAAADPVFAQGFDVCENCVIFGRTAGVDALLLASVFDTQDADPDFLAAAHAVGPSMGVQALPGRGNLYGPDEGLAHVVGFFEADGATLPPEKTVHVFQLHCLTAASSFTAADDAAQASAASGFPGTPGYPSQLRTVQNRTGTWIAAFWMQEPNPMLPVATLHAAALATTRSGAAPALSGALSNDVRVDGSTGLQPVLFYALQQEVGYQGIQSDPDALTVAFQHDAGVSTDTLRVRTMTFAAGSPPSFTSGTEQTVTFPDATLGPGDVVVAEGASEGAAAGDALLYFLRDAGTSPQESVRAYQLRPGGAALEIGSLCGAVSTYSPREAVSLTVRTLPADADTAARPGWAGLAQHVFLTEYRHLDSAGSLALRHRVFDMTRGGQDALAFSPPADGATPPQGIDTGQDQDASGLAVLADGESLGVFFLQAGHLWYNAFTGGAWLPATAEDPGPRLVDHLDPAPVSQAFVRPLPSPACPGGLRGAGAFFTKTLDPGGSERLFARFHE